MVRRLWSSKTCEEDCVERLDHGWYEFQAVPFSGSHGEIML